MGKKVVSVCEVCGKLDCSGELLRTEDMYGGYGLHIGVKTVCRSHLNVKEIDGRLMYAVVSGHGMVDHYYVFPTNTSDAEVKEKSKQYRKEAKEKRELERKQTIAHNHEVEMQSMVCFFKGLSSKDKKRILKECNGHLGREA